MGRDFHIATEEEKGPGGPIGQLRVLNAGGTGQNEGSGARLIFSKNLEKCPNGRTVWP
jgi:hypothetical protein